MPDRTHGGSEGFFLVAPAGLIVTMRPVPRDCGRKSFPQPVGASKMRRVLRILVATPVPTPPSTR